MGYVAEKGRELALGGIKGLLKKLWEESKPGLDRSGVNRFRYDAGNVRLFGRDDELVFLWEFCHSDNHFSWFAISGEGGSGKTRLAYTLGKLLKYSPGWSYRKVDYARPDGLADAKQLLRDAPQNTLLVLDYVKWHTDSIGKWLYDLWCDWHDRNLKIRVLLVERDAILPRYLGWQHDVMAAQYRPSADAPFLDDNNLMRLRPLDDDDMINVVNDYAAAFDAQVDASLIIETLKKIDPALKRPLYALFLTDAFVIGEDLRAWDQSAALEYIYSKERARIQGNVDLITSDKQDAEDLTEIAFRSLLTATLSGGMEWDKYVQLHSEDVAVLQSLSSRAEPTGQRLLAKCLGTPYEKGDSLRIPPLEPDLMGEFFCIQQLWHLKDKQRQEAAGSAMLNDMRRAAVVFDRIAHDYGHLLEGMEMYKVFTEVSLPESMTEVFDSAFAHLHAICSIRLSSSIKKIGHAAFFNCKKLNYISFGEMLSEYGTAALGSCEDLATIEVAKNNAFFTSNSGVLYTKDLKELLCVPAKMSGSFIIPTGVQVINSHAFHACRAIEFVEIPETVQQISEHAFRRCGIASVTLPATITSIGNKAFADCSNLSSIVISDSIKMIEDNAFYRCFRLRNVFVYGKVTNIISKAFKGISVTFHNLPNDDLIEAI